jgi:hypothetical protein
MTLCTAQVEQVFLYIYIYNYLRQYEVYVTTIIVATLHHDKLSLYLVCSIHPKAFLICVSRLFFLQHVNLETVTISAMCAHKQFVLTAKRFFFLFIYIQLHFIIIKILSGLSTSLHITAFV